MSVFSEKGRKVLGTLSNLPRGVKLIWTAGPKWVVAQAVLLVIRGILPAVLVYLTKLFIDNLIGLLNKGGQDVEALSRVIWIGVAFGALTILSEIMASVIRMIQTAQAENITDYVFSLIHKKSIDADLEYYEQPEFYDHLHRARIQARSRPKELNSQLGNILQNLITLVSMAVVLSRFGLWLPLVLVLSTLPTLYVVLHSTSRLHAWQRRRTADERRSWYYDQLLTKVESAPEIKLFKLGAYFRGKFVTLRKNLRKQKLRLEFRQRVLEFGASFFALILAASVFVWFVFQTIEGVGTVGDLALFYQIFSQGQNLTRMFLGDIGRLYSNSLFLSDLFEYLDMEPKIFTPDDFKSAPRDLESGITFEDVTFGYRNSEKIALDGLSLFIPAKQTVAVVGPNGAGKSTLIKLLCRFYDPDKGRIKLDGSDLRDLSLDELHRMITILFQMPVRYSTPASENIALGDIERLDDLESIEHAAMAAGADDIIAKFPARYDQMLGKRFKGGQELSTGEWQRVALARAFFRESPIVLLDEPTSAMDPWAEADWIKKLMKQAVDKTVLIITHRFTTASQADLIYVMENGQIVETGTHHELVKQGGHYSESWAEQVRRVESID